MVLLAAMCQVIIQCGALPNLLNLCSHTKKAIRKETLWTISNITAGNKDQIEEVRVVFFFSARKIGSACDRAGIIGYQKQSISAFRHCVF